MFVIQTSVKSIECFFKRDGSFRSEGVFIDEEGIRVRHLIEKGLTVYSRYSGRWWDDEPGVRCSAPEHGKHDNCRMVEFRLMHTVPVPEEGTIVKNLDIRLEEAAQWRKRPRGVDGPVLSVLGGPRRGW